MDADFDSDAGRRTMWIRRRRFIVEAVRKGYSDAAMRLFQDAIEAAHTPQEAANALGFVSPMYDAVLIQQSTRLFLQTGGSCPRMPHGYELNHLGTMRDFHVFLLSCRLLGLAVPCLTSSLRIRMRLAIYGGRFRRFPCHLGLGWENLHLLRLPTSAILSLALQRAALAFFECRPLTLMAHQIRAGRRAFSTNTLLTFH